MKDKILKILTKNFKANHMEYQNALNELLNLHSVSKCCDVCDAPLKSPAKYYDCSNCGEIVQSNDC